MRESYRRVLLVEGKTEERVIPYLIEAHGIGWGPKNSPIVKIVPHDGVDRLLEPGVIGTWLKASGLTALGVIVDADDDANNRWWRIREQVPKDFVTLPEMIPREGFVVTSSNGIRFGTWIMPDNQTRGMLETFLCFMLPDDNAPLREHSKKSTAEAQKLGATFKEIHLDKAEIYTWLAWNDPPGLQLHQAVQAKALAPGHACATAFVVWFRSLFSV